SGAKAGTGFMGVSDAATQLRQQGQVTHYTTTGATPGNVAIYWQMPEIQPGKNEWLFVLGFGESAEAAQAAADASLARGYENILAHYNGEGDYLGWEDYLASLPELPPLADTA